MKEISEKLHKRVMDDFYPVAEQLAREGRKPEEIVKAFQAQLKIKTAQYYDKIKGLTGIKDLLVNMRGTIEKRSADSKAEVVFYNMLHERRIPFEFQFPIGPYTADYLFAGFLVVEIDGPHHSKKHDDARDSYMRKLGYKIIRAPMFVLMSCPEALIDEIREAIESAERNSKKGKKKR